MNKFNLSAPFIAVVVLLLSCQPDTKPTQSHGLIQSIIDDNQSFYHVDFSQYPVSKNDLPIGVFDSGTGGLTVLKAIVNFDENGNEDLSPSSDGIQDFLKESFIYLGDQANMPYGKYPKEGKVDLLKEHIIKDAQFLLSNKYYQSAKDTSYQTQKRPVKAIVVACNTATAYGKNYIEEFLKVANSDVKVIGVIDAGARGALDDFEKDESGIIGVLATEGTVASKGYKMTIERYKKELNYTGSIEVFQQGGIGIAEALDEDSDYVLKGISTPRKEYKGPDLLGDLKIDKTLLNIYNFAFDSGKMLCDQANPDDCSVMQINDTENYVRYHLVTMMEKIRKSNSPNKLKTIILGCTHYPYLSKEIAKILGELYNYQVDERNVYQAYMEESINLIDPAVNTARELFTHLKSSRLFNDSGVLTDSEFYISVPNQNNQNVVTDRQGNFTYDYKYGRKVDEIQEYVKVVPFSRSNISDDILRRFKTQIPNVYDLMVKFSSTNSKTEYLNQKQKIQ